MTRQRIVGGWLISNILAYGAIGIIIPVVNVDDIYATVLAVAFSLVSAIIVYRKWKGVAVSDTDHIVDPPAQGSLHLAGDPTTRRRALFACSAASVLAAAAAVVVAVASGSLMVGAVVAVALGMLAASIVFHKWPVAGFPWYPWKGVSALRDADGGVNPVFPGLLRVLNIGWFGITGVVVIAAIRDIAG